MNDRNWLETIACVPTLEICNLSTVELHDRKPGGRASYAYRTRDVRSKKSLLSLKEERCHGEVEGTEKQRRLDQAR
jgi:hypothetical protein